MTINVFDDTRDDISSKQASKKTDFTVDLICWESLLLATTKTLKTTQLFNRKDNIQLRVEYPPPKISSTYNDKQLS